MKTIKFFALLLCVLYSTSCQKSEGPEKSGDDYPRTYAYAGLELHASKYYRWEGGTNFTELAGVSFPESYDDAEMEQSIVEYYDLFYPFVEFTLENDTLLGVVTREADGFPALDTTIQYVDNGTSFVFGNMELGTPYTWLVKDNPSRIESPGSASNFNYYDNFYQMRDYFAYYITEGTRLEKTEQEQLEEIVAANQQWLQPSDTIQLKLFEVVFDLK